MSVGGVLLIRFTRSGEEGGAVCSDFSIDPFDFDLSNRKLELQLTSFGDRFRDKADPTSLEQVDGTFMKQVYNQQVKLVGRPTPQMIHALYVTHLQHVN